MVLSIIKSDFINIIEKYNIILPPKSLYKFFNTIDDEISLCFGNKNVVNMYCTNCKFANDINDFLEKYDLKLLLLLNGLNYNFGKFIKAYYLSMNCCNHVENLYTLKNVLHILKLRYCNSVVDLSMFYNIHTLHIESCKNIKDIGSFKNINTLKYYTNDKSINYKAKDFKFYNYVIYNVYGFHLLKNIKNLTGQYCIKNNDNSINKLQKYNNTMLILTLIKLKI